MSNGFIDAEKMHHSVSRLCSTLRVSRSERVTVEDARRRAIRELFEDATAQPSRALVQVCGLPDAALAREMLTSLESRVWSAVEVLRAA